jgi:hypothetical protein
MVHILLDTSCHMWDNRNMNPKRQSYTKSNPGWLVTGILTFFVLVVNLTVGCQSNGEPPERPSPTVTLSSPLTSALSSPLTSALSSPLTSALSSPLSAAPNSPQPVETLTATVSPLPSPTRDALPTVTPGPSTSFQLTVLHTNDTWGYLLPCG